MAYMTRPLGAEGQVVLPVELRRALNLKRGDRLEIIPQEDGILLRKSERVPPLLAQAWALLEAAKAGHADSQALRLAKELFWTLQQEEVGRDV